MSSNYWAIPCALAISVSLHAAEVTHKATNPTPAAQPALARLVREVLHGNPGVQAARAAIDAARARERAASRPLYNPELGMGLEQAESDSGFLGLSQAIDWADKRGARTDVAHFERAATRAELAFARQALAGQLLSALARFQTARGLARLAGRRADLMRRFASVSQRRQLAGDLNQVDLQVARLAHAQAKLRRAQAASDVVAARQALAAVAGDTGRRWPSLPADLPAIEGSFDIERLLITLPQLRARKARIAAARSAIELSVRQRRPDPTIGLRGGREDDDTLVGLDLNLPLFVRNTFSAEVDVANAELLRTQRQAEDVYRRAKAQLISASRQYRITRDARSAWERSGQESLSMQLDLLKRLWQAGELGTTDFLVQLNQTLDTQASAMEIGGRAWEAWFDWLASSGRIDDWLGLPGT
ncbi:MAG: TolC family protein [Gammaproteobacteria bacterium]